MLWIIPTNNVTSITWDVQNKPQPRAKIYIYVKIPNSKKVQIAKSFMSLQQQLAFKCQKVMLNPSARKREIN